MDRITILQRLGYRFTLAGDRIIYKLTPGAKPDPAIAAPLLAELKARKAEAIAYLQSQELFDQDAAQELLADTLARLNEQCPFAALPWAQQHKPELWDNCQAVLNQVEVAFRARDMAAVRQAVVEFKKANQTLFAAYPGLPWRPGQKGTGGKVWQLTDQQAQELEALFAAPGVMERKGALWYSADAWLERTGRAQESRQEAPQGGVYLWQIYGKPDSRPEKGWRRLLQETKARLSQAMAKKDRRAAAKAQVDQCYIYAVLNWLRKPIPQYEHLWQKMRYPE